VPGSDLLLADEFFLTAHNEDGKALLSERVLGLGLGLGLAAAVLGELVLPQRLTIQSRSLRVVDRRPLEEPLGAWVLAHLLRHSGHGSVRDWMSYLAKTAEDTVGRRLVHHGHVRRLERQRLLRGTHSRPAANQGATVGNLPWASLRYAWQVVGTVMTDLHADAAEVAEQQVPPPPEAERGGGTPRPSNLGGAAG
jgi:Golgi phosphoprotein 3 (GPP34)